jgi:hypothetical protein
MSTEGQAAQKFIQACRIKLDIHREAQSHKQAWDAAVLNSDSPFVIFLRNFFMSNEQLLADGLIDMLGALGGRRPRDVVPEAEPPAPGRKSWLKGSR